MQLRLVYVLVMLGIAAIGVTMLVMQNYPALMFAGMAFFAWTHAYNLRYPATPLDRMERVVDLLKQSKDDPGVKVELKTIKKE